MLRIKGEYPAQIHRITDLDGNDLGEWRGDGVTKVCGTHPGGCRYAILNDAPPLEVEFDQIVWPENWRLPWAADPYEELVRLAGPPFTDSGRSITLNPQFFARLFAAENDVIFEQAEGRFYIFDPGVGIWVPRSPIEVREAIFACYRDWVGAQEPAIRDDLLTRATRRFGDDVVEILKGVASERDFFRPDPGDTARGWLVVCGNGLLLICADGIHGPMEVGPDARLRHRVPRPYDPGAGCPRFLRMLETVMDRDDIDLLQRSLGGLLHPVNQGQQITELVGPPASGKSTVVAVMEGILGADRVGLLRTDQLDGRFELGALAECTLLIAPDVPGDFLGVKGARALKSLVGGDTLRGELKYANARTIVRGEFHVIITTNHRLAIPDGDDPGAWRRRLVVIRFARPVPEAQRSPGFAQGLLRDEAAGILAWLVQGAARACLEILTSGRLSLTDRQRALVNEVVREAGSVEGFVRGRMARGDGNLSTAEILDAYGSWCRERGATPLPDITVTRELARLIPEVHGAHAAHNIERDGGQVNGYRGVVLR